jgi:hypothetical protein
MEAPPEKPIEIEPYRLIYSGRKIFWRVNASVDFNIYVHPAFNCIEIIGALGTVCTELNRLYLDFEGLKRTVRDILDKNDTIDDTDDTVRTV